MVRRISKDMFELVRGLWKILAGWHVLIWTFCIYTTYWANEQADTYLVMKFEYYQNQNATVVPVPMTDLQTPEDDDLIFTDDINGEIVFDE